MICIACDMNCNNHGNYFYVIAHERDVKEDKSSYIVDETYYPKKHCYRVRGPEPGDIIRYSQAIDNLIPEDCVRWADYRFGGLK